MVFSAEKQVQPSGETEATRLPPLFWYESDPQEQRKFMMALLLYWRGLDPSGEFRLIAPLYYDSKTPVERIRILLPFHFRYSSAESESSLWGPYFQKKSALGTSRLFFPLYFHADTSQTQTTFFLPYFRQKNTQADSKVVFPFFWSYSPPSRAQKSYQTLFPFYLKVKDEKSRTILSPFLYSYKDPAVFQGFAPPYFWHFSETRKTEVGFPLYWRFWKKEEDRTKDIQIGVPWFRVRSNGSSFRGLVPIYWGRTKIKKLDDSGATEKSRWNLLLPFFLHSAKPDGSEKMVTPLFSRFRDADGRLYGHSGPNFFSRDIWGGKTEGLFPFFYHREEPDFFKFRFLGFFLERDRKDEHFYISQFPLFRYRRDSDRKQFLTPLFYTDSDPGRSRGFFLPYFWRTDYGEDEPSRTVLNRKRFFVPLVWFFQSETEKTMVIPPLAAFYRRADYEISLVAPFYFRRTKGNDTLRVIPPMILRESPGKKWNGFLFVFWQSAGDRSSFALFPLFRRSVFPHGHSLLLPGFYYLSESNQTQGFAGPYFWDRRGKTQYDIFPPFYWHFQRPTWYVKTLFPFYTLKTSGLKEEGIFPFWAKTDSVAAKAAETKDGVAISTGAPKHFLENSHRVLPFYLYRKIDRGYDLYLPAFLGRIEKDFHASKGAMVRGRLFLLQYWEKSSSHFINRLDPLYSYHRSPDKKGFSVPTAPLSLWQYEQEGLGPEQEKTVRGAVFPYYWKESRSLRRDLVFPLFYRRSEKDEEGKKELARTTWLLTYYDKINHKTEEKRRFLVPFYWRFSSKDEEKTIVPPFWSEKGPKYKRDIFFPLWWSLEKDGDRLTVIFPFLVEHSNPTEKRRSVVFPGYWLREDPAGSSLVAGLYYRRRSPEKSEAATAVLPLFWHSTSPKKSSLSVFPFFWKWREGVRSVTYLFPVYLRHRRENLDWQIAFPLFWKYKTGETEVTVFPPYFQTTSKIRGTETTGFAPLWTYTKNLKEDRKSFRILEGLFGWEKMGEERHITLLWFFRI